jgi:hypothetical protein
MNFVNLVLKFVFVLLVGNRILFGYSRFKELSNQRADDLYFLNNACNRFDHKSLGDHATYCRKIEHKLSMSLVYHTVKDVIDDTLYRELSFQTMAQVTGFFCSILVVGSFYNKYIKSIDEDLPVYNMHKLLKND